MIREKAIEPGRWTHKYFLLQGAEDTTVWGEYFGLNSNTLSDSIWYNKEVGDTLHFDYIRKVRFFHKMPRK